MRLSTLIIAIAALAGPIASANAHAAGPRRHPAMPGRPECRLRRRLGRPACECVFQSEGRRPEPYIATVRRFGLDLGITEQTQLTWAVNAPTARVGRGDLAGNYGGVGANASVGIGGGGNFLVGGPAQCLRAAADQRAGPDRAERRGRCRRHRTGAGAVRAWRLSPAIITGIAITADKRQCRRKRPAEAGLFVCRRHSGAHRRCERRNLDSGSVRGHRNDGGANLARRRCCGIEKRAPGYGALLIPARITSFQPEISSCAVHSSLPVSPSPCWSHPSPAPMRSSRCSACRSASSNAAAAPASASSSAP